MTEKMLDDPDATHTKPIENLFGNLDRELKKTGPQGFGEASDNLIIKYSSDLIDSRCKWRTKANRQKARELKEKEQSFTKAQQTLIDVDVNEEDSIKLTQSNKILNCISACRKAHNGPITTIDELDSLVQD